MLQNAGIEVGWISGSTAASIRQRCPPRCRARAARRRAQGRAVEQLRAALNVPADACAHVGDDLPDVPLLAACGLAVTVPHAPESVRRHATASRREGGAVPCVK